jgi:hypothetical protein
LNRLPPRGLGAFEVVEIPFGHSVASLAVGDLDRDGIDDVVAATTDGDSLIAFRTGDDPALVPAPFGTLIPTPNLTPVAVVLGDFDRDGRLDTATAHETGNRVTVVVDLDGARIRSEHGVAVGPRALAAGDLDRDGVLDLAVATASGIVVAFRGVGDGSMVASTPIVVGGQPTAIALGDVDRDGILDAVVALGPGSGTLAVLRGIGGGGFRAPDNLDVGGCADLVTLALADFDRNGELDVFAGCSGSHSQNHGSIVYAEDGRFVEVVEQDLGAIPFAVLATDVDGDACVDLVFTAADSDTLHILRGDGTRRLSAPLVIPLGAPGGPIAVADPNHDGKLDFIVGRRGVGHDPAASLLYVRQR